MYRLFPKAVKERQERNLRGIYVSVTSIAQYYVCPRQHGYINEAHGSKAAMALSDRDVSFETRHASAAAFSR